MKWIKLCAKNNDDICGTGVDGRLIYEAKSVLLWQQVHSL